MFVVVNVVLHQIVLAVELSNAYFRCVEGILRLFEQESRRDWTLRRTESAAEAIMFASRLIPDAFQRVRLSKLVEGALFAMIANE